MARPTHGGLAFEIDVGTDRLKTLVDLSDKVGHGQIFNVLHGVNAGTVKVEGFHPPKGISDELL